MTKLQIKFSVDETEKLLSSNDAERCEILSSLEKKLIEYINSNNNLPAIYKKSLRQTIKRIIARFFKIVNVA